MTTIEHVEKRIMDYFKEHDNDWRARNDFVAPHIKTDWLMTLGDDEKDAYPDAVTSLISQGLIIKGSSGFVKLTTEGIEHIDHPGL